MTPSPEGRTSWQRACGIVLRTVVITVTSAFLVSPSLPALTDVAEDDLLGVVDTFCIAPNDLVAELPTLAADLGFQPFPSQQVAATLPPGTKAWTAAFPSGVLIVGLEPSGRCLVISHRARFEAIVQALADGGSARWLGDADDPARETKLYEVTFQRGLSRPTRTFKLILSRSRDPASIGVFVMIDRSAPA